MGRVLRETHRHPTNPRLTLDLRGDSPFYQARAFIGGRQLTKSTKTTDIRTAFRIAESWYKQAIRPSLERVTDRLGLDPIMADTFKGYKSTLDKRKKAEAEKRWSPIEAYWQDIRLVEIGSRTFRDFYAWRRRVAKAAISAHTLHKDAVLVRQVLKHAISEDQLDRLPIIPSPGKIDPNPRPWLDETEWTHLCAVSQQRIKDAPNERTKQQRIDCDHFMRFLVSSCGRVDEIRGLRFADCKYRLSDSGAKQVLICRVKGKRGHRELVTDPDAVEIISQRIGKPDDLAFSEHHRDAFRELLTAAKLRTDSYGTTRNFKSLRATAISRLVLAGRDLMFIARNAGTSVNMIDLFYARRLTAELSVRESHPIEVPVSDGRQ